MTIVEEGNKSLTTLYRLVSLIFLLTHDKLQVLISVNSFNYSTLGRLRPGKKVTTELKRQLLIGFSFLSEYATGAHAFLGLTIPG